MVFAIRASDGSAGLCAHAARAHDVHSEQIDIASAQWTCVDLANAVWRLDPAETMEGQDQLTSASSE